MHLSVMPVSSTNGSRGIVTDGQPCLRLVSHFKVVCRASAAHLRWNPSRIDGIAQDIRLKPSNCKCEGRDKELAIAVSLRFIPALVHPVHVPE